MRVVASGVVSLILASIAFAGVPPRVDGKVVVMVIAQKDFRDEELLVPSEMLRAHGAKVLVASTTTQSVKGMLGATVKPDLLIKDVDPKKVDAIVLVGGVGASQYWNDKLVHSLLVRAHKLGKVIGAICIAPVTLANAGLLKGRKATVWASEKARIETKGATYTGADVEVDDNIVTANGPNAAKAFGEALLRLLAKK
jgi:protease I